jgi:ankyrin repeat protein
MIRINRKAVATRVVSFLFTWIFSLTLTFAHSIYVDRQAVFISAAWGGRTNVMRATYALGVDLNESNCQYRTCVIPLVAATWGGHNDAVEFLLDRGADVNKSGRFGKTALMIAAFLGQDDTVRLLLSKGANVNKGSRDGDTALSLAQQRGNLEAAELLLNAGAIEGQRPESR